jgi:subtilisin family serine protease
MSAGYVSGAIALYLEAHPSATPDAVSDYIHAASRFTIVDPTRSPKTGLLYLGSERQGPERQRSLAAR